MDTPGSAARPEIANPSDPDSQNPLPYAGPSRPVARQPEALVPIPQPPEVHVPLRAREEKPEGWREGWERRPKGFPKCPTVEVGPCPDPMSPDFPRLLHAAFARRMWALVAGPDTTPQDIVGGYAATRLAARQGIDKPPVKHPRVKMASLLPPKPKVAPVVDGGGATP